MSQWYPCTLRCQSIETDFETMILHRLEDNEKLVLTPFEKNLDIWRQLWRVLERCDLVFTPACSFLYLVSWCTCFCFALHLRVDAIQSFVFLTVLHDIRTFPHIVSVENVVFLMWPGCDGCWCSKSSLLPMPWLGGMHTFNSSVFSYKHTSVWRFRSK